MIHKLVKTELNKALTELFKTHKKKRIQRARARRQAKPALTPEEIERKRQERIAKAEQKRKVAELKARQRKEQRRHEHHQRHGVCNCGRDYLTVALDGRENMCPHPIPSAYHPFEEK